MNIILERNYKMKQKERKYDHRDLFPPKITEKERKKLDRHYETVLMETTMWEDQEVQLSLCKYGLIGSQQMTEDEIIREYRLFVEEYGSFDEDLLIPKEVIWPQGDT